MAKKAWISFAQIQFATGFVGKQPRGRYAKDIGKDLNKEFEKHGFRTLKPSTLINLISKIRSQEGGEWTFVDILDIPTESISAVLQAWREGKLLGSPLTMQEAKWCARLSFFIKDSFALRQWAYAYANRERACEILKKPFDTSDLDMILTTPPWELATMYLVGLSKPPQVGLYKIYENSPFTKRPIPTDTPPSIIGSGEVKIEPVLLHFQAKVAEMSFLYGPDWETKLRAIFPECGWLLIQWWFADEQLKTQWAENPAYQEFVKTWKCLFDIAPVEALSLSQEAVRVYTLWLEYLAKGPHIISLVNLNRAERPKQVLCRLDMLLQLREWVKNHRLASSSEKMSTPPWPLIEPLDAAVALFGLKPTELLLKAGYEE